jgi:lipoprotein-releasing system ATP-binding protein
MMDEVIFSIDRLACSYSRDEKDKVLYIERLRIPRGKIVFLLGASGCGKSTLLETLGLMNNTIAAGSVDLYPGDGGPKINLPELWKKEDEDLINEVRKKYYSFIFQNTNLMENFTAYENVCLSGMIKEDVTQEAILSEARVLMERIKLPEDEVNLETLAVNLSGGQRQRLAFARAFNNKATVLFGDEPTGNLDEANARELFELIKSNLGSRLSSIIVSHDINLAVRYADQIIVITKEKSKNYGEVRSENIFNREDWQACSHDEIATFKDLLRSLYTVASENKTAVKAAGAKVDTSLGHDRLFFKREGKALVGRKLTNFFILSTILVFTFLAIGFANGSLDYLNKQLNDAFVNWITVVVPKAQERKAGFLVEELQADSNRTRYAYDQPTPYVRAAVYVWDFGSNRFNAVKGRSIDTGDSRLMHDFILNKDNMIMGGVRDGFKENDIGVIVTQRFLAEWGYPEDANFIYCSYWVSDSAAHKMRQVQVPVQVRAIVKVLPEKRGLIYPANFYLAFLRESDPAFDTTAAKSKFFLFYQTTDEKQADQVKLGLQSFLSTSNDYKAHGSSFSPDEINDTMGHLAGFKYQISFDTLVRESAVGSLYSQIRQALHGQVDTGKLFRWNDYEASVRTNSPDYDGISFYFHRLDSVRSFAQFLLSKADKNSTDVIEVDENTLKDKENFNFLSYVTRIISFLLIIFSALSVCLFIYNLLKSHLSKVKINIGTYKAIGLTDKESRIIYFRIVLYFMAAAVVFSFLVALILGGIVNFVLLRMNNINNISYFKIVDMESGGAAYNALTLFTVVWIIASALVLSRITIRKILNRTPGDLIYNR